MGKAVRPTDRLGEKGSFCIFQWDLEMSDKEWSYALTPFSGKYRESLARTMAKEFWASDHSSSSNLNSKSSLKVGRTASGKSGVEWSDPSRPLDESDQHAALIFFKKRNFSELEKKNRSRIKGKSGSGRKVVVSHFQTFSQISENFFCPKRRHKNSARSADES